MRIAQGFLIGATAAVVGTIGLWQSGCNDKPTEPRPSAQTDYPVYLYNNSSSTLWVFHPTTREFDSAIIPFDDVIRDVTVSADGELLYFSQGDRVFVYTADSLRLVTVLPYSAWRGTAVSPDDYLLAIMGDDSYIVRTTDWSVVFSDTLSLHDGVFSSDSRTLYAGEINDVSAFYWVKPLEQNPELQRKGFYGSVVQVEPTPREDRLIFKLYRHLLSYDMVGDSILYDVFFLPGQGRLALTPNGRYAFFSNPSTQHMEPGTTDLFVFDVRANSICDTIHIKDILDSLGIYTPGVGRMVVTPDNRWLVAVGASGWTSLLILYDLSRREAVYLRDFGANCEFLIMSLQHRR
jgi:hypothetical protein